jgi:phosphoglycerate dehydrogenase-like enzyme
MSATIIDQNFFWNREISSKLAYDANTPIVKEAKIVSLSDVNDPSNGPLNNPTDSLPQGSRLLAVGGSIEDFDVEMLKREGANAIFVSHPLARDPLDRLLQEVPSIEWIHSRSAGMDFVASSTLASFQGKVTNAKGLYSSTLAEYTMMACSYFAKDLPRLLKNKGAKNWEKYNVLELRGSTLGIVGYGDIGRAAARLALAYGMKVIALRRRPAPDDLCSVVYGNDKESLNRLFAECDYILCAAPLTAETKGMIGKDQFDVAKSGAVFINVGRGPIVDEDALIEALKDGRLKGAGLDVFATEPLSKSSPLWELDNVLLSPHNMDQTATFTYESTSFFVEENLPRFVRDLPLLNPVDASAGY